jgi:hypothetical protein
MADEKDDTTATTLEPGQQTDDTTAAAAADGGAATAPPAGDQTADGADDTIDFEGLSREELQQFLENGKLPEKPADDTKTADAATKAAQADTKQPPAGTKTAKDDTKTAKTDDDAAADDTAAAAAAGEFKFTENADDETFEKEVADYLETVEITPEMQAILDRRVAQVEALRTTAGTAAAPDADTERHMTAFNKLVDFREDPDTRSFVPDTSELIALLEKDYSKELPQVIIDLNSRASGKYPGHTLYEEFIRDAFELTPEGMENLDYFFKNKGQFPTPAFVPEGINKNFLGAFWNSPDREQILAEVDKLNFVITDDASTNEEKSRAQFELANINKRLGQVQAGLDAQDEKIKFAKQQQGVAREQITKAAEASYLNTSVELTRAFGQKLSKSFEGILDATGASVTGLSYASLIQQALTDDEWSKYAQEDLTKQGIAFDWAKGRAALDKLYDVERKIADLTAVKANARAIELAKRDKLSVLQEISTLETELAGKIVKKVVSGHTTTLKTKVQNTKKAPAVRPKVNAGGAQNTARTNFDDMSLADLRKAAIDAEKARNGGGNPYRAAAMGDTSGFA